MMMRPSWGMLLSLLREKIRQLGGKIDNDGDEGYHLVAPRGKVWSATGRPSYALILRTCRTVEEKSQKVKNAAEIIRQGVSVASIEPTDNGLV